MTAGCAACGGCCDPVIISADILLGCNRRARSEEFPSHNDRFITQHWHPLSASTDEDGTWVQARCDAFDPDTRLCTERDDRPPVCRDFPWYGDPPSAGRAQELLPQCSYQAELPPGQRSPDARPLIPITVISAREAA